MKITKIGESRVILENKYSKHSFFAWPTVARLKDGRIAVVASGYRLRHICPFGKTVISYSEDNGETYTRPAPVIDTVLDDRDGGILAYGKSNVIVTSFNNTVDFQRKFVETDYDTEYLNTVTPEEEAAALGSTFRMSKDNGKSFGEIKRSPVTAPHGPIELKNGDVIYIGALFKSPEADVENKIEVYKIKEDGICERLGEIEPIFVDGERVGSYEPHAIELDDGRILAHIRVQSLSGEKTLFTVFQSISEDGGRTWSKPQMLLGRLGGSPPHLMRHSSGILISTYGCRTAPFGIKAMFSKDNGETWDIDNDIYLTDFSSDLGYPASIELPGGDILTVFYAPDGAAGRNVIMQQKWHFE